MGKVGGGKRKIGDRTSCTNSVYLACCDPKMNCFCGLDSKMLFSPLELCGLDWFDLAGCQTRKKIIFSAEKDSCDVCSG